MKRYIIMLAAAVVSFGALAQDFDTTPSLSVEKNDARFTVGARMMADVAYYNTQFTPMRSGAALTDARIRTSMEKGDWYFYADFDFSKGAFKQKNLFLQYSLDENQTLRAGYYNDPSSMANNTSLGSYHFISRPATARALAPGRQLGVTYKYINENIFANQGIFAENLYNNQNAGYQGFTLGGRWLYLPINEKNETLHVGISARYAKINSGVAFNGTVQTNLSITTPIETYVDPTTQFMNAQVLWASDEINVGAEFLYRNEKMFVRGEYIYKYIGKERDDETLYKAQLGTLWSWASLESWQAGNPLEATKFNGGYVEAGYLLFGEPYSYNGREALLGGMKGRSLEVVARYNYTNLNDVVDGAYYFVAQDKYIDNGILSDYPVTSTSVGGGALHAATLGVNYSFNNNVHLLVDYTYSCFQRDKYPMDKNFHTLQGRLVYSF